MNSDMKYNDETGLDKKLIRERHIQKNIHPRNSLVDKIAKKSV